MVPGQIGLVQATEVVKLILGIGKPMIGRFYIYNALTLTATFIEVARNAACPLCGETPQIKGVTGADSVSYGDGGSSDPGY